MNCQDVKHPIERFKGKSMEFAGNWAEGVRYFNDEFLTSFVVYTDEDIGGNALLGCKVSHIAKKDSTKFKTLTDNQPHLKADASGSIIGLEPNNYWIFICGSLKGEKGTSHITVNSISELYELTNNPSNVGMLVYLTSSEEEYVIVGKNRINKIVTGNEIEKLQESKVDKVEGKGLSTEDYTTEDKEKLKNIESGAQCNIIEEVLVNGTKVPVINKSVNITTLQDKYTLQRLNVPLGNYFASYIFTKNGSQVGDTINIPRDTSLYAGSIVEVTTTGKPYTGAVIGDKYIDLILNDINKTHIYIPATKLMDIYSGDKYINVEYSTKSISLDYSTLKQSLQTDLSLKTKNIEGLEGRLEKLEDPTSRVSSLTANTLKATGKVNLDDKYFEIQPTTNTITLKAVQFESAGVAEEVRNQLTGSPDDTIDKTMTLYSLKNAIDNINVYGITADNIGKGLEYNTVDQKLNVSTEDKSSLAINDENKLDLIWN